MGRLHNRVRRALNLLSVSIVMALTPVAAYALSLGKLYVYSHLHAPLNAEIELIPSSPDDLNTLVAKVAAPWNSAAVSAESRRFLSNVKATVAKRSDQRYVLELRSAEPLSEPFLQFMLDVKWDGGSLVYDFTALIDPPPVAEANEKKGPNLNAKVTEQGVLPQQLVAPTQHPSARVAERVTLPTPRATQLGRVPFEPQTIVGTSHSVGEPAVEIRPESAGVESEVNIPRKPEPPQSRAPQSARPAPTRATTSDTQLPVARVPAGSQSALSATTELISEHPTWALTIVASSMVAFTLLGVGLVVLMVKRRPRSVQLDPESSVSAPNFVRPPDTDRGKIRTEGDRRWQDRRHSRDRRKRSVPVAIERRTGLARRRSELIDDGHATVSVEVLDPIAEAEAYLAGGCYSHAEEALKEAIADNPSRLDLKIKLLEVYDQSGNQAAFNALTDELRPALEQVSKEPHPDVNADSNHPTRDEIQLKKDSGPRNDVDAEGDECLIEWEPIEVPTAVANATAAQGKNQSDAPQLRSTAATDTLKEAFADFLHARKTLKPRTIEDYKRVMAVALADWHDKPLLEISAEMVTKRHQQLCADRSEAYANRTMRFLRTLYNFALARYHNGDSPVSENPVRCL
jgi:hypothetical protein